MISVFIFSGANVSQKNKVATSEFSGVSDLPPTEEVSDNELETLDELDQDFENPKYDNFDKQPSDNSFLTQNLPFDQYKSLNTYSQTEVLKQVLPSNVSLKDTDNLDSKNTYMVSL